MPTIDELERAIARLEFFKSVRGYWDNTADIAEINTALTVLRAELSRESQREGSGLQTIYETPYTCSYCGDHIAIGWSFCPECGTPTGQDRYEPKGEQP